MMQTIANRGATQSLFGKSQNRVSLTEGRRFELRSDFSRRISSATCNRTLAATFGRYLSKSSPEASLTNLDSDVSGRLRCLRVLSEMLTTRTQLCIPKVGVL